MNAGSGRVDPLDQSGDEAYGDIDIQQAYSDRSSDLAAPWPPRPGIFVALWPLFLLGGGLAAVAPFVAARYVDEMLVDAAIRAILAAFMVGLSVMLPLVRLSQARSAEPLVEAAMDAFSLLLPIQPLLWFVVIRPLDWRAERLLAMDLHMAAWTAIVMLLVGVTIDRERAAGACRPDTARRTVAMVGILLLQAIGPGFVVLCSAMEIAAPRSALAGSPVVGLLELCRSPRSPLSTEQWLGVWALCGVAASGWWIAWANRRSVLSERLGKETAREPRFEPPAHGS